MFIHQPTTSYDYGMFVYTLVSFIILLSMYILSVDSSTSNNELCSNECYGICFVFDRTRRWLQVSGGWTSTMTRRINFRIGRRTPLAVLTLISGLSSVSLAITLLGTGLINIEHQFSCDYFSLTGHTWLEITFSLLARGCLRICYCLLILFTAELYPTSVR